MKTRTLTFVLFCLCTAGIVVMCILGHGAVVDVCGGSTELFDGVYNSVVEMEGVLNTMVTAIGALQPGSDTSSMTSAISSVKTAIADIKKKVDDPCKKGGTIEQGSQIYFAVFTVMCLWGICGYMCKYSFPSVILSVIGFIIAIIMWLLTTFFLASGQLLDDTCVQLNMWSVCNDPLVTTKPAYCTNGDLTLDRFLKCPDNSAFKNSYNITFQQITNDLIPKYNSQYAGQNPGTASASFTAPGGYSPPLSPLTSFSFYGTPTTGNTGWRRSNIYTPISATQVPGCTPPAVNSPNLPSSVNSDCMTGAAPSQCPSSTSILPTCTTPSAGSFCSAACAQKSILVAGDLMWGNSYIASCRYLTAAAKAAVADGKACNKLGGGFRMLFASHGIIAACYCIITLHSYKVWANHEEDMPEANQHDQFDDGMEMGAPGAFQTDVGAMSGAKDKDFI